MTRTGEFAGVVLEGMDPSRIAEAFGVESTTVTGEDAIRGAIEEGLRVVDDERRPFLLDVRLPLGLPKGGRPARPLPLERRTLDGAKANPPPPVIPAHAPYF